MVARRVDEARMLAHVHLAALPIRLAHVCGVAAAADAIRGHFDVAGGDCLVAAAWLHDIGYARSLGVTGFHPVDGAVFARRLGFDELVVSLIAFHSGAPAEARERGINLWSTFSEPRQRLLDALTFCDLTTGPDGSVVAPHERLEKVLQRYGPEDPVHRAVRATRAELLATVERVHTWV